MFKNYIKIAWRSLKNQPFFATLNTLGLAVGISGFLLISLYIVDELSFDTMFKDADRIHRLNTEIRFGGAYNRAALVSAPMAETMKSDFSQVELTTRFRNLGSILVKAANTANNIKESGVTYVDASFFEMFGISLLYGDVTTALKDPNTLILTKSAVEKHFPAEHAVGQTLVIDNDETYTIVGVMEDLPKNSFLRNHHIFLSMEGNSQSKENLWLSHNFQTFIKLTPGTDIQEFQGLLASMIDTYIIPFAQRYFPGITLEQFLASGNLMKYTTIPLKDIHLHSDWDDELSPSNTMSQIYILGCIALFLIVLASVNFMNLSTAQSLKRAKEVGVRKTLGSNKKMLVKQFVVESVLLSFISLVLGIILSFLVMPAFNQLADKSITIPIWSPLFWGVISVFTILLGMISGSYPAFFMSRFKTIQVLKGGTTNAKGSTAVRNSLVIFQFSISILLIIGTLVVYQQLQFIQNKDLGFEKEQILIVNDVYSANNKALTFKEEVRALSQVTSASLSGYLPTPSYRNNTSFVIKGKESHENALNMQNWDVDHDYIPTLSMELVAGRNFSREFATDSLAIILNETAVDILEVTPEEAIGMKISSDLGNEGALFYEIIGVVKNFHFESLREQVGALSLNLRRSTGSLAVRLTSGDVTTAIASVENIWKRVSPGQPFNYHFMDDSFDDTYRSELRLGKIFMIFTILSIFVACLGLFGLAAFNAEKRTKEIGVRKVLGASVSQIVYKLIVDFLKLVGIAVLISLPLGWFAMNRWLEDFSYKITIGWDIFVLAALIVVLVSIITVSSQSIKAAIVNPIKSLRTE